MYLHARTQAKLLPDYINALEAAVKRGELCVHSDLFVCRSLIGFLQVKTNHDPLLH